MTVARYVGSIDRNKYGVNLRFETMTSFSIEQIFRRA